MTIADQVHFQKPMASPSVREPSPRARIAAWGMTTPFGNAAQTWSALLAGQSISTHSRADLSAVGSASADRLFNSSRENNRLLTLALASIPRNIPVDTPLILGTSKGPIEQWLSTNEAAGHLDPTGVAQITSEIAHTLNLTAPHLTYSGACASSLHALIRAVLMIRSREARRVLVVGVESSVHPLFLASFTNLGVFPKNGGACKPFDQHRDGFLMSEASAAILLEADEPTTDNDSACDSPRIVVDRFAMGGDAHHITASDPSAHLLRRLLATVINDDPIDLVHAHGTGTQLNDKSELAAIESSLVALSGGPTGRVDPTESQFAPVIYSHKAALGHSLGAAGLLALAINCESHRRGVIPGNIHTTNPLPTTRAIISNRAITKSVRRSLVTASGFGGPTAVVSLKSL